jgi:hypothetical protein
MVKIDVLNTLRAKDATLTEAKWEEESLFSGRERKAEDDDGISAELPIIIFLLKRFF